VVTENLGSSAYEDCSSQTDDVSSAQAVFSAYCGLLQGTTAFPTPSNPPGDSVSLPTTRDWRFGHWADDAFRSDLLHHRLTAIFEPGAVRAIGVVLWRLLGL
jgi:hypothetical protein